jgi:paraquat-inducible protein B
MTEKDPNSPGENNKRDGSPPIDGDVSEPVVRPMQRWLPSLVWLIPIIAALIGLSLVAQEILKTGPTISITFSSAEGIEPGKTKVKYKNVDIGDVKGVTLSHDLSHVVVKVELSKAAEGFAVTDTHFWVVRPRVALSGVSGLNTLLSGTYIGADAGKSHDERQDFTGLETPPAVTGDQKGHQYVLHSDNLGSLDIGSPVFFRRIQVGQVVAFNLDKDGNGVTLRVFVDAPYDHYVGVNTRFWHASGVDLQIDSNGVKLNTQSLAAVLIGGIAFQTAPGEVLGAPAPDDYSFGLATGRSDAMRVPDGQPVTIVFNFNQSLRGLSPGASLDFRGVEVGEVQSIGLDYDDATQRFKMPVTVLLYPNRLGPHFAARIRDASPTQNGALLASLVQHGLRAQLRTGNLLTGQLYIALDYFPKAAPAKLDLNKLPIELPTEPNTLDQLQNQVEDIAKKLDKVPFDQIGNNLNTALKSANSLFNQLDTQVAPEAKDTLEQAKKTFGAAQQALSQDSPLQNNLQQALEQLNRTLQSLNSLADYLERHPESLLRGNQGDKQ